MFLLEILFTFYQTAIQSLLIVKLELLKQLKMHFLLYQYFYLVIANTLVKMNKDS